jgi:CubicO group peptidase (beta-lactamase class C family)
MIRRSFLSLLLVCSAVAQLPQTSPEAVGLSTERLKRIDAAVQRAIDENRIAGAVTLVARKGKIAYLRAQGHMDREAGKPMTPDAIFRICSMTKPITSLAVMMLYEEGRFLLSDPVSKFLPEFKSPRVMARTAEGKPYTAPATREITIRDLLRHTSGLTYHWNSDLGPQYAAAGVAHGLLSYEGTNEDNVRKLASLPLLFNPGDRYEYSLSVDVLGRLVEVVSGTTLDQFFRTRIFEPLGMRDTWFYVPEDKLSRLAAAYTWYEGKGLQRFPDTPIAEPNFSYSADYPARSPKTLFAGGAGLSSTATDYWRFAQMMLDGGKAGSTRLISRKSVELMSHDQLGRINQDIGFGLGFGTHGEKSPLNEVGSPGTYYWGGFFYTTFFIDPKEEMIGVFMGQLHPAGGLTLDRAVKNLMYQAITD